jgi:hypothetical protein
MELKRCVQKPAAAAKQEEKVEAHEADLAAAHAAAGDGK